MFKLLLFSSILLTWLCQPLNAEPPSSHHFGSKHLLPRDEFSAHSDYSGHHYNPPEYKYSSGNGYSSNAYVPTVPHATSSWTDAPSDWKNIASNYEHNTQHFGSAPSHETLNPQSFEYSRTHGGQYDYSPSQEIADFHHHSVPSELSAPVQYQNAFLSNSNDKVNRWKGIRSMRGHDFNVEPVAYNTYKSEYPALDTGEPHKTDHRFIYPGPTQNSYTFAADSVPNYERPQYPAYQQANSYSHSVGAGQLPSYETVTDSVYKAPNYNTFKQEIPSYAPPRTFFKSVVEGLATTLSSSLKPMFGHSASLGWNPPMASNAAEFFQQPTNTNIAGAAVTDQPNHVQHVYVHSVSDKVPTELNLKLILVKPSTVSSGHGSRAAISDSGHWNSGETYSPPQFMSDLKRSKINAQLHFVRFKAPPTPKSLHNPFHDPKSTPTLHFLISKRNSEDGTTLLKSGENRL